GQPLGPILRIALIKNDVLALDPSQPPQSIKKNCTEHGGATCAEDAYRISLLGLLRARRERPRRRAAEQRDELAAPYFEHGASPPHRCPPGGLSASPAAARLPRGEHITSTPGLILGPAPCGLVWAKQQIRRLRPETVFSQSFGAGAKSHFQNPKVPPTGGLTRASNIAGITGRTRSFAYPTPSN